MGNKSLSLLSLMLFFSCTASLLHAETETEAPPEQKVITTPKKKSSARPDTVVAPKFEAFTGTITKGKVRLRIQPNYEGPVLREVNRNDLVVVVGETDEFYAIKPPEDIRGYVFRTYVLDNVVEGDRVNIRLQPDREATIVAQLKTGDRVNGIVAPTNNKWLEIKLPDTTRFYVSKDYIEKVGDAGFKERLDKKRQAATDLLNTTNAMSQNELQKPFDQTCVTGIQANYQHIINDYPEFPEIVARAKESLAATQKAYTEKKVAYLEEQSRLSSSAVEANKQLNAELEAHKNKISQLEQQIEQNRYLSPTSQSADDSYVYEKRINRLPINMSSWIPVEDSLFQAWTQQTGRSNPQEFYAAQSQQGFVMHGVIDAYARPIKNKPGDYMLINPTSKLPIAFLYSTAVNLQDYVGHEVSVFVIPRDNHNFAFPAYFVMKLE